MELATADPLDVVSCVSPLPGIFSEIFSFRYVVSPGDSTPDLSYAGTRALMVSPSTEVSDVAGAQANITLPEVGSSLSLTGGEARQRKGALVVDTSNLVLHVTSPNANGTYYAGASVWIEVMSRARGARINMPSF